MGAFNNLFPVGRNEQDKLKKDPDICWQVRLGVFLPSITGNLLLRKSGEIGARQHFKYILNREVITLDFVDRPAETPLINQFDAHTFKVK